MKKFRECLLESSAAFYGPKKNYRNVDNETDRDLRNYPNYIGNGAETTALKRHERETPHDYETPRHAVGHDILLKTKSEFAPNKSGKSMYLAYSARHAHENPHLPQVTGTKHYRTKIYGPVSHTISHHIMEPLHSLGNLTAQDRKQLWHHSFGEEYTGKDEWDDAPEPADFVSVLDDHVHNERGLRASTARPNKNLAKVLDVANSIQKRLNNKTPTYKGYTSIDLHSGNIMARKTPYGHQLVITDPLLTE